MPAGFFAKKSSAGYTLPYMKNGSETKPLALRIILFLLGAAVFIAPIIVLPNFFFNFTVTKTFFFIGITEIAVFLYIWLCIFYPEYRPKKNLILWGFLGFVAVSALSGLLGVSPTLSFWSASERADGIILLIHAFLFFLVFSSVVKSKKELERLLWVSLVSAVVISFSIYLGPAGIRAYSDFFGSPQLGGFTGNDSFAGAYFIFNLFFAGYLFFETHKKKLRRVLGVLSAFIIFSPTFLNFDIFRGAVPFSALFHNPTLFFGTARGATIGLWLGIVFTALLFLCRHLKRKSARLSLKIITGVFISSVIVAIALIFTPGTHLRQWFGEKTEGYRYIYWHQAMQGFGERPILGWGPDTFEMVSAKYFNPAVLNPLSQGGTGEPWNDKPHGIIFDILVSTGIVGILAYAVLLGSVVVLLWRGKRIPYYAKALFSGLLLAYFLQDLILFETLLSYLMLATLFGVIAVLSRGFDEVPANVSPKKFSPAARNTIAATLAVLAIFSVRYFAVKPLQESHLRYELGVFPPEVRSPLYQKISDTSPFGGVVDDAYTAEQLSTEYLDNLNAVLKQKDLSLNIAELDSSIAMMEKSLDTYRPTYRGMLMAGRLSNVRYLLSPNDGQPMIDNMKKYGKLAIALSPTNPIGYWDAAEPFIYEKNYTEALRLLEQGLAQDPSLPSSHQVIINLVRTMNDPALLAKDIERAKQDVPGIQIQ